MFHSKPTLSGVESNKKHGASHLSCRLGEPAETKRGSWQHASTRHRRRHRLENSLNLHWKQGSKLVDKT